LDDFIIQDNIKNGFRGIMKVRVWHALKPIGRTHVTITQHFLTCILKKLLGACFLKSGGVFWYLLSFYFQIHLCNFEITQVNLEGKVCQVPKQITIKLMTTNQQGPSP